MGNGTTWKYGVVASVDPTLGPKIKRHAHPTIKNYNLRRPFRLGYFEHTKISEFQRPSHHMNFKMQMMDGEYVTKENDTGEEGDLYSADCSLSEAYKFKFIQVAGTNLFVIESASHWMELDYRPGSGCVGAKHVGDGRKLGRWTPRQKFEIIPNSDNDGWYKLKAKGGGRRGYMLGVYKDGRGGNSLYLEKHWRGTSFRFVKA